MADKNCRSDLTSAEVREYLNYDPETGIFLRVKTMTPRNRDGVGRRAGGLTKNGYRSINIKSVRFLEHRLAFLWMTGEIPEEIDHKNGDPSDNRWSNLRAVRRSQNMWNARRCKRNSSGCKGVSWHAKMGAWRVRIAANGSVMHLGCFDDFDEAVKVRKEAEARHYGEFASELGSL